MTIDPKEVIARAEAQARLQASVDAQKKNLGEILSKHRGKVLLMMKDGTLIAGTIMLCTFATMALRVEDGKSPIRIEVANIADCEI